MHALPTHRARTLARGVWLLAAIASLAGCSTIRADSFRATEPVLPISATWDARVLVEPHANPVARLNAAGFIYRIDRDEFGAELARLVQKALRTSGKPIGIRELLIRVDHVDYLYEGPCVLDYRVRLGDAQPFGGQAAGNGTNLDRACADALREATTAILNDRRTRRFLGGGES